MKILGVESIKSPLDNNDNLFPLDEFVKGCEVIKLDCNRDGYLAMKRSEYWMDFAILSFSCSEVDGSNTMLHSIFHGSGTGGTADALRECRHTYWGEGGYIFYVDGELITAAFKELSKYFDDLVK